MNCTRRHWRACRQNRAAAGPEMQAGRAHGRGESNPRVQIRRGCKKPENVPKRRFLQQNNFAERIARNGAYGTSRDAIAGRRAAHHVQVRNVEIQRRKKARRQNATESCERVAPQKYARPFVELARKYGRADIAGSLRRSAGPVHTTRARGTIVFVQSPCILENIRPHARILRS